MNYFAFTVNGVLNGGTLGQKMEDVNASRDVPISELALSIRSDDVLPRD